MRKHITSEEAKQVKSKGKIVAMSELQGLFYISEATGIAQLLFTQTLSL